MNRDAAVRITVLLLSLGAIVGYGYALAGLGGFLVGRGSIPYITRGLAGGTVSAAAALWIYSKNLGSFFR